MNPLLNVVKHHVLPVLEVARPLSLLKSLNSVGEFPFEITQFRQWALKLSAGQVSDEKCVWHLSDRCLVWPNQITMKFQN